MPINVAFQDKFFSFTINNVAPGGATTATLRLPEGSTMSTYYKYGPTPDSPIYYHWYEFMYDGQTGTGAVINNNIVTLYFVDGQRGDDDLTANGTIVDIGGPGVTETPPTAITLSSFTATPKAGKIILTWNTESEINNAGFNLYRAESENGNYTKINASLIPAKGSSTQGASYEFTDTNVQNRKTYYYKLEDIDLRGIAKFYGPISARPR